MYKTITKIVITICFITIYNIAHTQQNGNDSIDNSRGYIVKLGDIPENIEFNLIDGSTTSLDALKGKIVVLQFTASWCSVCRKEMPHLEKEVWQRFKNEDFILIGVDYNEPLEKVIGFKNQMKVTYPMALDPDAIIFQKFAHKKSGVTRNIVLNKEGKIVFLTRLYDPKEFQQMVDKIEALLDLN
ncbi:MAG: redoxin [Marinilabiliales bacterium]|nr:MAG: redoxin [Marinilabiliales bacterium]